MSPPLRVSATSKPISVKLGGAAFRKVLRSVSWLALNTISNEPVSLMLRNELEAVNCA